MLNPKLLQPGWAGELTSEELAFIKKYLNANCTLRAEWGMGREHGYVNDDKIRAVAMDGVAALQTPSDSPLEGVL